MGPQLKRVEDDNLMSDFSLACQAWLNSQGAGCLRENPIIPTDRKLECDAKTARGLGNWIWNPWKSFRMRSHEKFCTSKINPRLECGAFCGATF